MQSKSVLWRRYRRHLVTASSVKKICAHIAKGRYKKAAKCIDKFGSGSLDHVPAVVYGRETESTARAEFRRWLRKTEGAGAGVAESGLVLHETVSWCAASPDGIVTKGNGEKALLEIKCPWRTREVSVKDASLDYIVNGTLKRTHTYYNQIQHGMYCTGTESCYFYVYSPLESLCVLVARDEGHIQDVLTTLTPYYKNYYVKNLYTFYSR